MAAKKSQDYHIAAVIRAFKVLKLFDREHRRMSLTEISQRIGINRSSVLRILDSLEAEGFVRRSHESKKYTLGIELFKLGNVGYEFGDFRNLAYPFIKKMVDEIGIMAHLGILDNDQVVVIAKIWPQNAIDAMALVSVVGGVVPSHCTGVGKVLLAFSDDETTGRVLDSCRFEAYTPRTITSRDAFEAQLAAIRKRGYAQNLGEHESYIHCTTYPIFNGKGDLLAALSLTGLEQIVEEIDPATIHKALRKVTREIQDETYRYNL
ncbi:MAG: IclR family transcriptional regulator [Planctomycetota bacterium]|nr:IclR family transcriptional regulator [Planctomycetota bacterium]